MLVLTGAGFAGDDLVGAYNAFIGSMVGWVGVELIPDDPELGSDPIRMAAAVHDLPAADYPTVVANRDRLANQAIAFRWQGGAVNPLDAAFEFALATWIGGLRAQLARTH